MYIDLKEKRFKTAKFLIKRLNFLKKATKNKFFMLKTMTFVYLLLHIPALSSSS